MEQDNQLTARDYLEIGGRALLLTIQIPLFLAMGSYMVYDLTYGDRIRTHSIRPRTKKGRGDFFRGQLIETKKRFEVLSKTLERGGHLIISYGFSGVEKLSEQELKKIETERIELDKKRKTLERKIGMLN
ncbi:MAG: hypothetical protein ABIH65_01645 [Nanoarchaeota archaeon]